MERSQSCRSKTRLKAGFCLLCLCLCGLLWACVPASRTPTAPLPRANPGYIQWLERQSMLAASPQYTRLVSGTEILFRLPAADTGEGRIDALLEAADTWIFVYPPSLLTEGQRSVMAELQTGPSLHQLKLLGIGGVYMAPTAESAALWTGQADTPSVSLAKSNAPAPNDSGATTAQSDLWGEEATSLTFAPHVGTESQFTDLARSAGREQLQLGAGLVPAAIGIGPDFLLATRHVRDYPGSVMMVDVPKEYWHLLPPTPALARPRGAEAPAQEPTATADIPAQPDKAASPASAPQKAGAEGTTPPTLTAVATPTGSAAKIPNDESPYTSRAWAATALNGPHQAALDALVAKNIVPPALVRDSLPWASHSGWAATPIMEGIDGVERRFVYRYYGSVNRPVLQWDDPSRNAQRILSASTIRTIGSQQQTLGGLYPEAWAGLDVAHGPTPTVLAAAMPTAATALPEPAAAALRDLSREIRRYGGWSMQADVFPPSLSLSILATGVDFTLDTITSPTAEYALLTGDTLPLKEALNASLAAGIDHRRLVHTLPHYKGLDLRPLYDSAHGRSAATTLQAWLNTAHAKAWLGPHGAGQAQSINATAASLAAMAAGYSPRDATRPEHAAAIQARHMLLTSLRAGMPGLLMLSGADLSGALNVPASTAPTGSNNNNASSPLGGWGLSAVAQAGGSTRTGLARAPSVYGPVQAQAAQPDSYTQQLTTLLAQRRQWGLARAQLVALPETSHPSTVALLVQLPDKSYALTVANFSDTARSETIRVATTKTGEAGTTGDKGGTGKRRVEAGSPRVPTPTNKHEMRLELDPWQCRLIHIQ